MKAEIVEYRRNAENEFEHRLNVMVRYNKKPYAVTITTFHRFDNAGRPVVEKINSFGYISTIARKSEARDKAIKNALIGMNFEY